MSSLEWLRFQKDLLMIAVRVNPSVKSKWLTASTWLLCICLPWHISHAETDTKKPLTPPNQDQRDVRQASAVDDSPRVLNLPDDVEVPAFKPAPRDPKELENIARALEGTLEGNRDAGAKLPEAVREIMDRNGSILSGSSLDASISKDGHRDSRALADPSSPQIDRQKPARTAHADRPDRLERKLRAAEMLLKTARLVDKLSSPSENQRRLVNQMRQQAVALLAESAQVGERRPGVDFTQPRPASDAEEP